MVRSLCKRVNFITLSLFNVIIIANCLAQNQKPIEGNWKGIFELRLIFKISSDQSGKLTATFDSPDQEAINIPVSDVTFKNDTLRIEMDVAMAAFVGIMNYDEQIIEGHFIQGGLTLPMRLERITTLLEHMAPRVTESGERQLSYAYAIPEEIDDGWKTAPMSAAGIDSSKIYEAVHCILNEEYKNIHALLVVKNGQVVVEEYFYGFRRDKMHPIASVTKSITSTLAGISKDQNHITDLDKKVSTYFPEYSELFRNKMKNQITLYHLLTMTGGFDWDEHSVSYFDLRNNHFIMDRSGNPIKYLFERPMLYQPGEKYVYNSGLMITLGEIVERASSIPLDKFAEKYLFDPLGISDYSWQQYPDSIFQAGGGLQMLPRDMAKLGLLYMSKGQFKGKRIVSEEWYNRSSQRTQECEGPVYWNHWFPSNYFIHDRIVEVYNADGLGGQFIFAVPSLDMIVVFTSSIFGNTAQPSQILKDYILPSVITPSFIEKRPDFGDRKITRLENLSWSPKWHTELGCVKGCLDYFKSPASDAWLYGATGYAFIINVHEKVLSNSVGVWNNEMVYELGKNLGYETNSFWALKSQDDFHSKQELAWNKVREAIDDSLPCYGFQLGIPESYIIYGYDKCGYYYKGVMSESGGGPKFWQELGDTDLGYLGIFVVKPCDGSSDIKTVKDALQFALEHSRSPEKWIYSGYKAGPAGYDNWIRALENGTADGFGVAYNAAVWSECRSYAAPFLEKAKNRLPAELHSLFDEAIAHYEVASENLHHVSKVFPFLGVTDEQRETNVKDTDRCLKAVRHLKATRDAETAGLKVLQRIVNRL